MKNKKLLVLSLISFFALVSCGSKETTGETIVHFETGYESFTIDDVKPTNGKISKPSPSADGITIYGYYADQALTQEFDFNSTIKEEITIYVKALKGDGSDSNPYIIESGVSLNSLTHLGSDINGTVNITKSFETYSIYSNEYEQTKLNGVLNGNGNTITFLNDEEVISNTGILYYVSEGAEVHDLILLGHIKGAHASVGALTNFNYGTLDNIETVGDSYHASNGCNIGVSLMTTYDEETNEVLDDFGTLGKLSTLSKGGAGGVAGTNYGTIQNSINKMMVSATIGCGSMAGINYGTIVNCVNRGAIGTTGNYSVNSSQIRDPNFDFSYAGGMAGANYGTIHQCVNANQVFACRLPWIFTNCPAGQSNYSNRIRFGGMAGANFGTYDEVENKYIGGIITECTNLGRVHGDMQVGGIAGYSNGYISDCFSSSFLGGRSCVASICGWQGGDKEGDRIGVVTNCVGLARVMKGTFPATIQDKDGNIFAGEELTDSSNGGSNINEFYKTAKYASKCVYHNNSGNINPIDPNTNTNTSITTTAVMSSAVYDQVSIKNGQDTHLWNYRETTNTNVIAPFSGAWQVYLNVLPKWQEKTISYVINGETKTIVGVVGVLYIGNTATASGTTYSSSLNSSLSCIIPGRGLPTRGLGIDIPTGYTAGWSTVQNDPTHVWDGIVRGDITLYPVAVKVS